MPARQVACTKMQGVGNDFVVVDGRSIRDVDWSSFAADVCRRRFSVGADGLLVIGGSSVGDLAMWMYNPDGTRDVCGNGLRCAARYAVERLGLGEAERGVDDTAALTIETFNGVHRARVQAPNTPSVRATVDMGKPRFAPPDIPMLVAAERVVDYPLQVGGTSLPVTALSTGSTHAVTFVETLPDEDTFQHISPLVENHALFPERTSLMWVRVAGPGRLEMRIWERGAQETLGCGTGACAAVVAARLHGLVEGEALVASKGGEMRVAWSENKSIVQSGPAEYVFEGAYPLTR